MSSPDLDAVVTIDAASLETAIDLVGDAVLVYEVDEHGPRKVMAANDAALRRYGYTREEIVGLPVERIVVAGGLRRSEVAEVLLRDGRVATDGVHLARDGREFAVEVAVRLVEVGGESAAVATVRDVSERRRAEAALRASEERLRMALSVVPLVLARIGRDLRYEWVFDPRPGAKPLDDGARAGSQLPEPEAEALRAIVRRAMDTGEVQNETLSFSDPAGKRDFRLTISPVRGEEGVVVGAALAAYDVTELGRAEEALRDSEERLRLAQRAASIGTWEADPATGHATWSEGMWDLVGVAPRDVPDLQLWTSLIHPEDAARAAASYMRAVEGADSFAEEYRLVRPSDGSTIWVASRGRVIRDAAGRAVRVLGVNFDITDRRTMEEALRVSEERSSMAQRAARVGTWEVDSVTGDFSWSEGIWEILGVQPGSVEPSFETWSTFVHEDDREGLIESFSAAVAEGREWTHDFRLVQPGGGFAWVAARGRPVRDASGAVVRMAGVTVDVTDRKAAEAAVSAAADELRRFADAMPQLAFIAEGAPGEPPQPVYYNEQWYVYTGMPRSQSLDRGWTAFVHPDDLEATRAEHIRSSSTGTPFELEYRFRRHDGEYRWFLGRAAPVATEEDHLVRWFGTCTDIHDLKAAEAALADANAQLEERVARRTEALRASQALLDGVLQTSLDAVVVGEAIRDEQGSICDFRWTLVNPAAAALFGVTVEKLQGRTPDEAGVPFRETEMFDLHVGVVETGDALRHRLHYSREGYTAWVDVISVKLGDGYAATFRDITAQVDAERALRASETRFRLLVEGVADYAIFLLGPDGRVISWNAGAERMKGYTAEEALGYHLEEFYDEHERDMARAELREALETGRAEGEGWRRRRDGTLFWASTVLTAIRDDAGRLTGFARLTRDDTQRRESEQALRDSEERFRSLFSSTPIGVAVVDTEGRLMDANPALCRLLGRDPADLAGVPLLDLAHSADRRFLDPLLSELLTGQRDSFQIEGRYSGPTAAVWAQTTARVVRDPNGSPLYVVASVSDVTERRELEQAAIEAAEAERRRLSYELHDDLAQRLAGASVLSHTLAEKLGDDGHAGASVAQRLGDLVRDAMAHARALSRALAPVDLLSEGLAEALERLCASTEQAYGVACVCRAASDTHVSNPAVATHLFRIAQEAVSNAARHSGATAITVGLDAGHDELTLTISDDGSGIPTAAMGTTTGLGLRTMRARAAAMGGTLELNGTPVGTSVRVKVPTHGAVEH